MPGVYPTPIPQLAPVAQPQQQEQQQVAPTHQHLVTGYINVWGEKATLPEEYFQYEVGGVPSATRGTAGLPRAPSGSGYAYYTVHPSGPGFYKGGVRGDPWKEYLAEHGAPSPQLTSQVQQYSAAAESQYQARLYQVQTGGLRSFGGTFSDYSQRMAAAPIGTPIPTQQEYMKIQQLQRGQAVFGSEKEFYQVAKPLSQYGAFAGSAPLRGSISSIVTVPSMGEYLSRMGAPLPSVLSKDLKRNFELSTIPTMGEYLTRQGAPIPTLEYPRTFNILEGRVMQTYAWTKEASFGKSIFGREQGAPEIGATYRKSWFGEYSKIYEPRARITTPAGLEAIRAADIIAPMFTSSGVFTSSAALKGASLGFNFKSLPGIKQAYSMVEKYAPDIPHLKIIAQRSQVKGKLFDIGIRIDKSYKLDTTGFAGRFSEYTQPGTPEPHTYQKWLTSPTSGYSSESPEGFYKRLSQGFIQPPDEPYGLFSKDPGLETRTTLQLIDKRQFGFKGSGGFEITPRETKTEPLGKMMGDLGKGRQAQALIQLPQAQKTVVEQIKPAFVLKTEQVFSRSKVESMGAYRSSTSFGSMSMPKSNIFSGLKPSKTALMLSDISYETYRYPPGKKTKTELYTSSQLKTSQNVMIGGITGIKPAQILSIVPAIATPTATGTSLKPAQITATSTQLAMRTALITPQITRQTTRTILRTTTPTAPPDMPRIKIPPFAPSFNIFQTMKRKGKGKRSFFKFPELARVAAPKQLMRRFRL